MPLEVHLRSLIADVIWLEQKGVMISHRNVIANVLQITTYERPYRQSLKKEGGESDPREVVLGLLPQSHIYSLVVICHASMYRGDQVINLPKFDFEQYLSSIQRFKINQLYLVWCLGPSNWDCLAEAYE